MIFGISMVRDEADVIAGMLTHLAGEVDHILIADNNSTDGTAELISLHDDLPLTLVYDRDPAYYQSDKMSRLAEQAAGMGATWIIPVDADELWYSRRGRLREVIAELPPDVNFLTAPLYNHFPSAIDPEGTDPFQTIVWRQINSGQMGKIAFRYEPGAMIHQGNHDVTLKQKVAAFSGRKGPGLEIRHFPYRTEEQFIRKARNGAEAYQATDLDESYGSHWRSYGEILERYGEAALAEVFHTHFRFVSPIDNGMVYDPAPYLRWMTDPSADASV